VEVELYKLFMMFKNPKLVKMVENTPPTRDRYVDFLRAFSITVVVIGHWISAVGRVQNGDILTYNAVGTISGMWILTWVMQVMPLFFFVGGFSNYVTIEALKRRGESIVNFYRKRAARLLKPTIIFVVIWAVILIFIALFVENSEVYLKKSTAVIGPLWFLVVYLGIIVVTPFMVWLHRSLRFGTLAILAGFIVLVDIVSFGIGMNWLRWTNVAFVWLFVHQIGFFYADGSLVRLPKTFYIGMAIFGLAGLILLTNIGVYPRSMVGTGLEEISNMNPPTVCIAVLAVWLIGLAMYLREAMNRWLARNKPWIAVIAANSMIMTLFLWHLTAYAIVFLLLFPLGLWRAADGSLLWWLMRPVWIILSALVLSLLIGIFGRFEH
jgi:fucose 4-O-acetylase-like acetyltransferase